MSSSFRPVRHLLAAALALAAVPAIAQEHPYSQTVFIGDSLTDSGYFRPVLIQAIGPNGALLGKFTTNPALVWSEWLADYYGTSAAPGLSPNPNVQCANIAAPCGFALAGGTNFAAGGARVGNDSANGFGPVPSLATQMNLYLAANDGQADPNALYTVWGGANDLFAIVDGAPAQATIGSAVTAEIGIVGSLQAAGARYVIVPTVPDIGLTPSSRAGGPAAMAGGTALTTAYNNALFSGLASQNLRVIPVDTFHFLQEVAANPAQYGFSNVTSSGCGFVQLPNGSQTNTSLLCNPSSYVDPSAPDTYLFADGVHPSAAAHRAISQLALNMLEAPRQIAALPHSASAVGRARSDVVATHLVTAPESDGMRWWSNLRGDYQRYGDGDAYDGAIPALSGGVDWTRGNMVYGAFVGYGRGKIDYGLNKGEFEQSDATLGGFVGWYGDTGGWANLQLSYSQLSFDVDRDVQLGAATRRHTGSPDGKNITAAINAGWNLGNAQGFQHGPVLSLISQRIDVDGFRESDPELSTSLAYPDQSYDALTGSAGWQVSYATSAGFTPYARLSYDHEFEESDTQVFARSQSLVGTLDYAVPGREYDRNYGTVLIGGRMSVGGFEANVGASTTVDQKDGNNAGVFATIGRGF